MGYGIVFFFLIFFLLNSIPYNISAILWLAGLPVRYIILPKSIFIEILIWFYRIGMFGTKLDLLMGILNKI